MLTKGQNAPKMAFRPASALPLYEAQNSSNSCLSSSTKKTEHSNRLGRKLTCNGSAHLLLVVYAHMVGSHHDLNIASVLGLQRLPASKNDARYTNIIAGLGKFNIIIRLLADATLQVSTRSSSSTTHMERGMVPTASFCTCSWILISYAASIRPACIFGVFVSIPGSPCTSTAPRQHHRPG